MINDRTRAVGSIVGLVGLYDGTTVGLVGAFDGTTVGVFVGTTVGLIVGHVGVYVGDFVGLLVGCIVGLVGVLDVGLIVGVALKAQQALLVGDGHVFELYGIEGIEGGQEVVQYPTITLGVA